MGELGRINDVNDVSDIQPGTISISTPVSHWLRPKDLHEFLDTSGCVVIGRESLGQKDMYMVNRDLKILDVGGALLQQSSQVQICGSDWSSLKHIIWLGQEAPSCVGCLYRTVVLGHSLHRVLNAFRPGIFLWSCQLCFQSQGDMLPCMVSMYNKPPIRGFHSDSRAEAPKREQSNWPKSCTLTGLFQCRLVYFVLIYLHLDLFISSSFDQMCLESKPPSLDFRFDFLKE